MSDTNWNDVGDKIKDAVDSAISTGDFSNLSRSIGDVINDTIDNVKGSVKTAAQQNKKTYSANPYYKTIHTESAPDQPASGTVQQTSRRSGRCYHQYSTGLFRGYFYTGRCDLIYSTQCSRFPYVSGSPYHFRYTCSRWFLPWYQRHQKDSPAESLSKLCTPD